MASNPTLSDLTKPWLDNGDPHQYWFCPTRLTFLTILEREADRTGLTAGRGGGCSHGRVWFPKKGQKGRTGRTGRTDSSWVRVSACPTLPRKVGHVQSMNRFYHN